MVVELSEIDFNIIINWAEQATKGLYSLGEQYVLEDEEILMNKLKQNNPPASIPEVKKPDEG